MELVRSTYFQTIQLHSSAHKTGSVLFKLYNYTVLLIKLGVSFPDLIDNTFTDSSETKIFLLFFFTPWFGHYSMFRFHRFLRSRLGLLSLLGCNLILPLGIYLLQFRAAVLSVVVYGMLFYLL